MRTEELYLRDIVEAADAIQQFVTGVKREAFLGNEVLRSAVLHKLTIIGEAAACLSKDFRAQHPEVEWQDIVAFRNIAVHAYFRVDWSIVWTTATQDARDLRRKVAEILAKEYPHAQGK
jgi:uncharacterized protein with HEPN domain